MGRRSNGEGTICKRSDGRWMGQVMLDTDGGYKRKTVYGKTQKEVKEKIARLKLDCQRGKLVETSNMPLEDWMQLWITNYKPDLKVTTRESYELYINVHIKGSEIGKIPLNKLKTTDLQKFYNAKLKCECKNQKQNLSPTTVRYINIIIKGALRQAVNNRMINENVSDGVVLPKKNKVEIIPLTKDEVIRFLEVAKSDRLYTLYLLEMMTGLRRGEILGLKWEDVDFKERRIKVIHNLYRVNNTDKDVNSKYKMVLLTPKTESSKRIIPLNQLMVDALLQHKKEQEREKKLYEDGYRDLGMVFCKPDGDYISPREFLRQYQRLLHKAGLERKRFHDLRHTVASLLINANENPKVIQQLLGHSTISTTLDIYAHVMEQTINKSVDNLCDQLELNKQYKMIEVDGSNI